MIIAEEVSPAVSEGCEVVALTKSPPMPQLSSRASATSAADVPTTLERLETLSVALAGYRTERFPGFYVQDSGYAVPWVAQSATEVAGILRARDGLGLVQALVVANPIPDGKEMACHLHERTLAAALKALNVGMADSPS